MANLNIFEWSTTNINDIFLVLQNWGTFTIRPYKNLVFLDISSFHNFLSEFRSFLAFYKLKNPKTKNTCWNKLIFLPGKRADFLATNRVSLESPNYPNYPKSTQSTDTSHNQPKITQSDQKSTQSQPKVTQSQPKLS